MEARHKSTHSGSQQTWLSSFHTWLHASVSLFFFNFIYFFIYFFFFLFFYFYFILFYFIFIYLFIYLWLCWVFISVWGLSLVAASGGHSSSWCTGLSLSWPLLLRRRAGSVIVAHGPSCSAACGIFPDQGSNPCPLHWQADSQPLRHQGSPLFFKKIFIYLFYYLFWLHRVLVVACRLLVVACGI